MNLHGKVKMIKEADYFLDTTGSDKGKKLRWTKIYEFNQSGNISNTFGLGEKGDSGIRATYKYDKAGRILSESEFSGDGPDLYMYEKRYFYDSSGNNVSTTSHNSKWLTITTKSIFNKKKQLVQLTAILMPDFFPTRNDTTVEQYDYDKHGNKIKTTQHIDSSIFYTIYSYDENHNCIGEQTYDKAGGNYIKKITRQYNEAGDLTEEISYEIGNVLRSKKNIEYLKPDKQGNWTEQRIHWHDLGTTVLERTIEYYR